MRPLALFISTCAIATMLGACTADVNTRGNIISETKLSQVQPNVTTQIDVKRMFGPPSLVSPFEKEAQTWYYAGQTTERMGIFKHEIVDQKIVRVDFDNLGTVTRISQVNPAGAQDVDFVDRETPTAGKEFTLLQQLIGNLGRFNGAGALAGGAQNR